MKLYSIPKVILWYKDNHLQNNLLISTTGFSFQNRKNICNTSELLTHYDLHYFVKMQNTFLAKNILLIIC